MFRNHRFKCFFHYLLGMKTNLIEYFIFKASMRRPQIIFSKSKLVSCQACHAGRDPASKTAWIPACAGMTILGHTTSYG
jgi:hypothetical protein